jgi:hypothetical protein
VWTTKVVRPILHALGVRLRRWRHRHLQAQPEEQAALRDALGARLVAWPEDWAWMFVDEATGRSPP